MATTTPPSEPTAEDLKLLIAQDLTSSNELAARIAQLRLDIAEGKPLPDKKVDLMERSNKDMTKDLVSRVEKIENAGTLDAADREMLQVLNDKLAVCDLQAMRLAELRDVEFTARSAMKKGPVQSDPKPDPKPDMSAVEPEEHGTPNEQMLGGDRETEETTGHDSASVSGSEEEDSLSEYPEDDEINKSAWPFLYQMLDVDPDTRSSDFDQLLKRNYSRLAFKHSPNFFPNNPEAPALWEKISKAYAILIDSEKRTYYNAHGNLPPDLESFDLSVLGHPAWRT